MRSYQAANQSVNERLFHNDLRCISASFYQNHEWIMNEEFVTREFSFGEQTPVRCTTEIGLAVYIPSVTLCRSTQLSVVDVNSHHQSWPTGEFISVNLMLDSYHFLPLASLGVSCFKLNSPIAAQSLPLGKQTIP